MASVYTDGTVPLSQLMRIPGTMGSIDLPLWQNIYIFSVHNCNATHLHALLWGLLVSSTFDLYFESLI